MFCCRGCQSRCCCRGQGLLCFFVVVSLQGVGVDGVGVGGVGVGVVGGWPVEVARGILVAQGVRLWLPWLGWVTRVFWLLRIVVCR